MMSFNGESSSRKRVSLGGRSKMQTERKKHIEDVQLEREQRSLSREEKRKSGILSGLLSGLEPVLGKIMSQPRKEPCNCSIVVPQRLASLRENLQIIPRPERITWVSAYGTELIPALWKFIKGCHENEIWSTLSKCDYLGGESPAWLLPLAVFCPVYKKMLTIVDSKEFYDQPKPLSLEDIRRLIVILRDFLWQLLWVMPMTAPNPSTSTSKASAVGMNRPDLLKGTVICEASEILFELQDFNNRRPFTSSSDFHVDGVDEFFISQAAIENTSAHNILKRAPFLVPFAIRVKIFYLNLASYKVRHGSQSDLTRNPFIIRRDHLLEDAYSQMNALSKEDLRGPIRVSFVNELGVEEAGIDGGGIFKDFMENITRAAFNVQNGLFKETANHLLYPNPGSLSMHEQPLQLIHFLGTLLAKAMYEGILVDIPFATFFLRKLKQKDIYVRDLSSLDPELYRHFLDLKHLNVDISQLESYFVIANEYPEHAEEELVPGGKNKLVTNDNFITFVTLVAEYRLISQIRQQSLHFRRGFQQLIPKKWIDMFHENELQLLISGSLDSLDVDDLRCNTEYAGFYHSEHYVIKIFWGVVKGFSSEIQKKFLKFVTGCSRGPLLGFRYLEKSFCIQNASEEALDRLPTSATCVNMLRLPPYRSKEQMEEKLLCAINAEAGFDLS